MCGINAAFAYANSAPPISRGELLAVRERMHTRGPDGAGDWISSDDRVGLAHRRLSIIDLSESGAQPMWNADRTLGIVFNGEIYNYAALRSELIELGHQFSSGSDTEVLLQLYARHGARMLERLRGMYAFALWDVRARTMFLARDPFGIKPLYYSDDGRTIRVASQIRALREGAGIGSSVDPAASVAFFLWGSIPDPLTVFSEIRALPAGCSMTVREGERPRVQSFCSITEILRRAEVSPNSDGVETPPSAVGAALRDTVEHHLVADVPVGVFLSAGLDSSTVTALVSESHPDVRTVTLGFEEFRGHAQDETPLAETIAKHYGTNHETIWVTRQDFDAEVSALFRAMDSPSIDGVNTYFVSLAAKRAGLKVAMSGLGGDEIFAGYSSFREIPRLVRSLKPAAAVPAIGRAFRVVAAKTISRFTSPKFAGLLEYGSSYPGAYLLRRALYMPWELTEVLAPDIVREGWGRLNTLSDLALLADSVDSPRLKVSSLELGWYMRHRLLRDADWAGMAHSLEIRVPLIDVQFLRSIAPLLASAAPPTKRDMASTPAKPLPSSVLDRKKTGFSIPVRDWLMQSAGTNGSRDTGLRRWAREVHSRYVGAGATV
jgi:asparagine synthase (glutamine-hydrolysing)